MRRTCSLILVLLLFPAAATAHEIPSGDLAALGRIWGIVNYAHPWIGYRAVELDEATLRAIARVRGGATAGRAVDELLRAVGDDASHVSRICYDAPAPAVDRGTRVLADGVVYLNASDAQARTLLKSARAAVVDLRPQPGRCSATTFAHELEPLLVRGTIPHVRHRKVRHFGYRSHGAPYSDFDSSFQTVDVGLIQGEATTLTKVVFIVNERSAIPPVATALFAANQAAFVSAGTFPLHTAVDHCQMALGDGSIVTLRTSELIDRDGYAAEPAPTITMAADAAESDVLAAALQLARPRGGRRRASGLSTSPLGEYEWSADQGYVTADVPPVEQRILAAFRLWNVVHFFHGARELLGPWDRSLGDVISTLEHATTRRDYELALAEVMARVPASFVQAPAVLALHGASAPPFELMPVEGKPVVTSSAAEQVRPGDELLRIDGREAWDRITELSRYASAFDAVRDAAKGEPGTVSRFTFRRPDGSQYEVSLARAAQAVVPAKAWRILDGNVAYVDLRTLDDVEAMLGEVMSTRAMILDLRGEVVNAAIVRRLNTTGNVVTSMARVPILLGGALDYAHAVRTLVDDGKPKYEGRTIALVDERTDLRTALALRAVARTQFVGMPAAAAHGDVSQFLLPGNIRVTFAASELQFADGRDARGVQPDFVVQRTIRGLADGRDEALDAALAILADQTP